MFAPNRDNEFMLMNALSYINIVGLYGVKDDYLIDPNDPDCDLVVLFRSRFGKMAYSIDDDSFVYVDGDKIIQKWFANTISCLDTFRKKIHEYLSDVDGIIINKKDGVPGFDKMTLPIVRRAYPTIMAQSLVSVQPMNTPMGLTEAFLKSKTPSDTQKSSEGQEKPKEDQGNAKERV